MNTISKAAYEGDIVSRLRNWRGLHLAHSGDLYEEAAAEIERLRSVVGGCGDSPQPVAWAVPLYRTQRMDTTPGEGSVPKSYEKSDEKRVLSDMTNEPVAWIAFAPDGSESSAVYSLYEQAQAAADEWNWDVAPLYARPTLTDAEREKDFLLNAIRRLAAQDATLSVVGGSVIVEMDATLTDEEREAISYAAEILTGTQADTLRSLLERLQ